MSDLCKTDSSYLGAGDVGTWSSMTGSSGECVVFKLLRTAEELPPLVSSFSLEIQSTLAHFFAFKGRQDIQGRLERAQTHRLQTAFLPLQEQQGAINSWQPERNTQTREQVSKRKVINHLFGYLLTPGTTESTPRQSRLLLLLLLLCKTLLQSIKRTDSLYMY